MTTTTLPSAWLSHRAAGRTRLHVPAMRMQRSYFARARERLVDVPGIRRVSTNIRTASILIEHARDRLDLAALGVEQELFHIEPDSPPVTLSEQLRRVERRADAALESATGGRVDLTGAAALAYTAFGAAQVVRGETLPAALTLFWSAFSLLRRVPD
jgi:hypothetical protein